MSIVYVVILCIVVFWIGAFLGFMIKTALFNMGDFDGSILVTKEDGKILYSLELRESPELIEFKNELIFKVVSSAENPNRK